MFQYIGNPGHKKQGGKKITFLEMKPIPNAPHEAQETPKEETKEHRTGKEAHPYSPLAREIRKGSRKRYEHKA